MFAFPRNVRAQDASAAAVAEQALGILFELGLPDARGAKWVKVQGGEQEEYWDAESARNARRVKGNAWLLREEKDGTVEFLVNGTNRWKARLPGKAENRSDLPIAPFETADLDKDLEVLAIEPKKAPVQGDENEFSAVRIAESRNMSAGRALLILAHAQRAGKREAVRKALPAVLAGAGSPEQAIDAALSLIADGRLAALRVAWTAKGDAAAYASSVEALCAEFTRGWRNRGAAQMLVQRLREQKPSAKAADPDAKRAADMILALSVEELQQLPMNSNWFLPSSEGSSNLRHNRYYAATGRRPPTRATAPVQQETPVTKFLANKRGAAAALAKLLGDHRMLRAPKNQFGSSYSHSYHNGDEDAAAAQQAYQALDRPMELGEVANALIQPVVPQEIRWNIRADGEGASAVLAWVARLAGESDEDLAWNYMRRANGTYDSEFGNALSYLIAHGGPASQEKLKTVFLDPAVWRNGADDQTMGWLSEYLGKQTGDQTEFATKLKETVKTAIVAQRAERGDSSPGFIGKLFGKGEDNETNAQLKKLEQLFKPSKLSDLLADVIAADEKSGPSMVETLNPALAKLQWSEAEPQLYQAAAKAKATSVRFCLVRVIEAHNQGMAEAAPGAEVASANRSGEPLPKLGDDTATRDAILSLLDDQRKWENSSYQNYGINLGVLADEVANAVVQPRLSEAERKHLQSIAVQAPQFAPAWLGTRARALAKGEVPPPFPDAARVKGEALTTLVKELGAMAPAELGAALRAKTPDEQIAVIKHLANPGTVWPASVAAAHLTITNIEGKAAAGLGAEKWKGRKFDESIHREISEALEISLMKDGKAYSVVASTTGTLAGFTLTVSKSPGSITQEQFDAVSIPGVKSRPLAAISHYFMKGPEHNPHSYVFWVVPLWKDLATNQAWRTEHGKPAAAAPTKPGDDEARDGSLKSDSAAFHAQLKALFDAKPETRSELRLNWSAALVSDKPEEDDPEEMAEAEPDEE